MSETKYAALNDDNDDDEDLERCERSLPEFLTSELWSSVLICFVCFGIGVATTVIASLAYRASHSGLPVLTDSHDAIPIRREWRSLAAGEKSAYVGAVKCLASTPSILHDDGSLHDDFVWVHQWDGEKTHGAASFLPWHRWFVHLYEETLRTRCGYNGGMPYWDWAFDWQNPSGSSIWNSDDGFGGDGDPAGEEVVKGGRCVRDGPFSQLQLHYYNKTTQPHCLCRGFHHNFTGESGVIDGSFFRPEAVGELLESPSYDRFRWLAENRMHNALHLGINGDFGQFSAANDPLFYLHHVQLDRLWWRWQNAGSERRFNEYDGPASCDGCSPVNASLSDILTYTGLSEDITVGEVIRTSNHRLSYRY